MEHENVYVQLKKENYIEIKGNNLTAKRGSTIITDKIENFVLSHIHISSPFGIHTLRFVLQHFEQEFRWCYDSIAKKEEIEAAHKFMEIMDKHGVFENRTLNDVNYNPTELEKATTDKPVEKGKQTCPKCGGENYHAFVEEKVIREGETKKTVSLNLNPLKPFTVFEEKEKVVREPRVKYVSKFVCDDCGKIFKPEI